MSYVLINHGWGNRRPEGHWQRHLALALREQGHTVSYVQYPQADTPVFDDWSELLVAELALLVELREARRDDGELIVIGHSLACSNIMKSALQGRVPAHLRADRLLLVAPSEQSLLGEEMASFRFKPSEVAEQRALSRVARDVTVLASDEDEWIPSGVRAAYTDTLGIEPVIVPGAKHFAPDDGFGYWQGVIDWVTDPSADLSVRTR